MPVQRTLFGRPITLQMPPRRFQAILVLIVFVVAFTAFYGPPAPEYIPTYEEVAEAVKHPHVPDLGDLPAVPNPFGASTHKPPIQPNSTSSSSYRAIEWLSDFKWRNPFSSSVAFDENRAVLPPLRERPPIFTYYDAKLKQDKKEAEAEHRLILAWRRAWWAQGFKPQVLSRKEAKRHPQYQLFQRMKLDDRTEIEITRWLAWGHMGGGILANWLALPMAEYENAMLSFLRRREYPKLSRVESLNTGVFFGDKAAVDEAIRIVLNHDMLKNVTANKDKITQLAKKDGGAMVNLLPAKHVSIDKKANGIAYYNADTIASRYKTVDDKLTNTTQAEGLDLLANLINSHLHMTFQELHPDGIAITKPLPEHTTALISGAIEIARNLTQCPTSPMPKTCPPNRPKCTPCKPSKPRTLCEIPEFVNTTKHFTIGTVPHPYTITSLHYTRDTLDPAFLRSTAKRNLWLTELTRASTGKEHSEAHRLLQFKDLVAAHAPHTLWLTAERITHADLDWIFGFQLPQLASPTTTPSALSNESELILSPPGPTPKAIPGLTQPDEIWITKEQDRLRKAREALRSKDRRMKEVVDAVEKWSLADTEAWKFARAWSARNRMERKVWEAEEAGFAGSERKAGFTGGRWLDGRSWFGR